MTEERKYAILFPAALLCARKLMELDSDKPSPAKVAAVENAARQAASQIARDESLSSNGRPRPEPVS